LLLIHAAGQHHPDSVTAPTSEMFVHDEVAAQIWAIAQAK
jgi:hypothetical protein